MEIKEPGGYKKNPETCKHKDMQTGQSTTKSYKSNRGMILNCTQCGARWLQEKGGDGNWREVQPKKSPNEKRSTPLEPPAPRNSINTRPVHTYHSKKTQDRMGKGKGKGFEEHVQTQDGYPQWHCLHSWSSSSRQPTPETDWDAASGRQMSVDAYGAPSESQQHQYQYPPGFSPEYPREMYSEEEWRQLVLKANQDWEQQRWEEVQRWEEDQQTWEDRGDVLSSQDPWAANRD